MNENEILTIEDVCKKLKLTKNQVYHLTSARRIPCFKVGKSLRFRMKDIDRWIDDQMEYYEEGIYGSL
jgi:excisionase family DNA binding protein